MGKVDIKTDSELQPIVNDVDTMLKLIPQRPPFVMVDRLYSSDDVNTKTGFYISDSNILTKGGFFTEPGIIENIAQTAAVRVGYYFYRLGKPAPPGYIGAIKALKIYSLPKVGGK